MFKALLKRFNPRKWKCSVVGCKVSAIHRQTRKSQYILRLWLLQFSFESSFARHILPDIGLVVMRIVLETKDHNNVSAAYYICAGSSYFKTLRKRAYLPSKAFYYALKPEVSGFIDYRSVGLWYWRSDTLRLRSERFWQKWGSWTILLATTITKQRLENNGVIYLNG